MERCLTRRSCRRHLIRYRKSDHLDDKSKMGSLRAGFVDALLEIGKSRQDVVVLGADTTDSLRTYMFGEKFPDRLFDVGIAEQNMIGVSAGLAFSNKTVFCGTFTAFLCRAVDQIRNTIAYCNLDVKIVGSHAGLVTGPDGAAHQTLEDLAIMRTLPNMRVIAPSDYYSTYVLVKQMAQTRGPFYLRILRTDMPNIYTDKRELKIGRAETLIEGSDIAIIANGALVNRALTAAVALKAKGISAQVIDCHTIKPLDRDTILKAAKGTGRVITAEDHSVQGGMGSAIAELLSEEYPIKINRMGVKDKFGESGEPDELLKKYGLTEDSIIKEATKMVGQ